MCLDLPGHQRERQQHDGRRQDTDTTYKLLYKANILHINSKNIYTLTGKMYCTVKHEKNIFVYGTGSTLKNLT
jgi:hypothetical protein